VQCVPKETGSCRKRETVDGRGTEEFLVLLQTHATDAPDPQAQHAARIMSRKSQRQGAGVRRKRIDEAKLVVRCPFRRHSCRPNVLCTQVESSTTPPVCSSRCCTSLAQLPLAITLPVLRRVLPLCLVVCRSLHARLEVAGDDH
jgi:hypothetical protein